MAKVKRPKKHDWEEDFPPHHVWKQRKKREQEALEAQLEKEEDDNDTEGDRI